MKIGGMTLLELVGLVIVCIVAIVNVGAFVEYGPLMTIVATVVSCSLIVFYIAFLVMFEMACYEDEYTD